MHKFILAEKWGKARGIFMKKKKKNQRKREKSPPGNWIDKKEPDFSEIVSRHGLLQEFSPIFTVTREGAVKGDYWGYFKNR